MLKRVVICALALAAWSFGAHADEQIASHAGLTATVIGDKACNDVLKIAVDADSADTFGDSRDDLTVLLKAIRTKLRFDCAQAEDVLIEGRVSGQSVYRGAFSKGTGWTLVDLTRVKPAASTTADESAETPAKDKGVLVSLTKQRCETRYKGSDFCICAMEQLNRFDLSLAEWELISRDFSNIVELSKTVQDLKESIRACYG